MNPKTLPLEKKVDIIFTFLFDQNTAEKEEKFWSKLTSKEVKRLEKINVKNARPLSAL